MNAASVKKLIREKFGVEAVVKGSQSGSARYFDVFLPDDDKSNADDIKRAIKSLTEEKGKSLLGCDVHRGRTAGGPTIVSSPSSVLFAE